MTEQQAPTLRELAERLDSEVRTVASFLVGYGDVAEIAAARLRKASNEFDEAFLALAKNIDTASPSPASAPEFGNKRELHVWSNGWQEGYAAEQGFATPQPSPTGPREGEPT